MSPRAYCALQCAVPAILIILDRRGGSTKNARSVLGRWQPRALVAPASTAGTAPIWFWFGKNEGP